LNQYGPEQFEVYPLDTTGLEGVKKWSNQAYLYAAPCMQASLSVEWNGKWRK